MQMDRNHPLVVKRDMQCTYDVKIRRVHATTVVAEKQYMLHTQGVFVVLGINTHWQRHIVICGLACCTIFPYYFINCTILEKNIEHKVCVLVFSTTFVPNISPSKKKCARYEKNVYWSSCKVPIILFRF